MKAEIIFEHEATARAKPGTYVERTVISNGMPRTARIRTVGTIIDQEDAWKLVACGLAKPADEECAARFTPKQLQSAIENGHQHYMRINREAIAEARAEQETADIISPSEDDE